MNSYYKTFKITIVDTFSELEASAETCVNNPEKVLDLIEPLMASIDLKPNRKPLMMLLSVRDALETGGTMLPKQFELQVGETKRVFTVRVLGNSTIHIDSALALKTSEKGLAYA